MKKITGIMINSFGNPIIFCLEWVFILFVLYVNYFHGITNKFIGFFSAQMLSGSKKNWIPNLYPVFGLHFMLLSF